jgi:plastocyanin
MRPKLFLCMLLLIAGCAPVTAPVVASSTTAPATQAASPTVAIDNFRFNPSTLTINRGSTVTWVNRDDVPHTATGKGASPAFDSNPLDTDEKFSFTFTNPGTYEYYCKVHPHMVGVVIVK